MARKGNKRRKGNKVVVGNAQPITAKAQGQRYQKVDLGPKLALTLQNGTKVFGSRVFDAPEMLHKADVFFRLFDSGTWTNAGPSEFPPEVQMNKAAEAAGFGNLATDYNRPIVFVDWPDYGTPALGYPWWDTLYSMLTKEPLTVLVACDGGHGRTGSFLSILAALDTDINTDIDPVEYVREHYREMAVESGAQVRYVEQMTGRKVMVPPSSFFKPAMGQGGTYLNGQATSQSTLMPEGKVAKMDGAAYGDYSPQEWDLYLEDKYGLIKDENGEYHEQGGQGGQDKDDGSWSGPAHRR